LIAEINRGSGAAGDADDVRIILGAEREAGEWHRDGNAGLQDKIRAKNQKEDQQENDVQQRNRGKPAELIIFRAGKLHAATATRPG
jgi:hypothetical protein